MMFAGWCGGMSAARWLLMAGLWAGFLAVVVWAVLWLFPRGRRDSGGPRPGSGQPDDGEPGALDTGADLDRRLAAGEIDADEYLRRRGTLTGARCPAGHGGRDFMPCPP
jgi:hypothetical protein